jgi:hypothetical protein
MTKVCLPVARDTKTALYGDADIDAKGYVNQHGLSRKVCSRPIDLNRVS